MTELEQGQLVLAVLLMLVGAPLLLQGWERLRRGQRRRRASAFALALAQQLGDPHVGRYAEELAYAALIGDVHLSHAQRKFLLSVPDAEDLVARYLSVQALLVPCCDERRFIWRRARHEHHLYRSVVRIALLVCYLGSCVLAFLPVITWALVHGGMGMSTSLAALQAGFGLAFLWIALWSLRLGQRLSRAELLAAGGARTRGIALEALYPLDKAYLKRSSAAND